MQKLRTRRALHRNLHRPRGAARPGIATLVLALTLLFPTLVFAQSQTRPAEANAWNDHLEIGPVPGVTTTWHPAPLHTGVPLGETIRFRTRVGSGTTVRWTGAREVERTLAYSVAEITVDGVGPVRVAVEEVRAGGEVIDEETLLEAVDLAASPFRVTAIGVSADPLRIDPVETNRSTLRHFFQGSSIATLRAIEPDHYATSIDRWLVLEADVEPALLAPLVEWSLDGEPQRRLGASIRMRVFTAGTHAVSAGPADGAESFTLDTYLVRITSPGPDEEVVDGAAVTYTAVTEPPGHEEHVTWLASTKYGSSEPVVGSGPTFTVRFLNTLTPAGRWLGVLADHTSRGHDVLGRASAFPPPVISASPGLVTVAFTSGSGDFELALAAGNPPLCEADLCRSAVLELSDGDGARLARIELGQYGSDLVAEFITDRSRVLTGFCNPYPFPFPNPWPFPNPYPHPLPPTFPVPYPPLPYPCPILCVVGGPPCDVPTYLVDTPYVHFVAGEDFLVTSLGDDAGDLVRFVENVEGAAEEGVFPDAEVLRVLQEINEVLFYQEPVTEELDRALVASGLRDPLDLDPLQSKTSQYICGVAGGACGIASTVTTLFPNPVTGFAAGFTCGAAFGWNLAGAIWDRDPEAPRTSVGRLSGDREDPAGMPGPGGP